MKHEFRFSRRGFTLVELLAVIAIIGVLGALATVAVWAMVGRQKVNNTQATIKVVNKVLQSHWQFVVAEAKKDTISPAVLALAQPDPTGERAQVLWIKFRLMEAFPQSYADITSPFVYNFPSAANPFIPVGQQKYIAAYQKNLAAPHFIAANNQPATQSAACLLMALSINRGGVVLGQDQIGFAVADTDGDGVKELVDGWTKPMLFRRFDTSAPNPAAPGAKSEKLADPLDPDGMLLNSAWYGKAACTTFEHNAYLIETSKGSGIANYVIPSITSAGNGTPIISYQLR